MANQKLSAITASGANLVAADTLVGINAGTTDLLFSGTQIKALMSASPTITGHATIEGVTATGATGTGKFVFDGTPTLVTPVLGVATGTSIALGGATIGSNALAITGTMAVSSTGNIIGALTLGTQGTTQGSLVLGNTNSTNATTVKSSNSASAAYTLTLPTTAGTDGYVLKTNGSGVTDWVQLATGPTIGTTTVTSGTGGRVFYETSGNLMGEISGATSDGTTLTLVAPVLGAATATSINKMAITAPSSSSTLAVADGKTATISNTITFAGTDSTTMTFPPASASIGYLNIPINGQNAGYTCVAADAGKAILFQTAGTFTIPANGSVPYAVGTVLTFINGSTSSTIPITSDTMTLVNSSTTGTRTLAANGIATAIKLTSTTWLISGTGLT